MRIGQISIQSQPVLAFSNSLGRTVGKNMDDTQIHVGLACCGAIDRALIKAASAEARNAAGCR